MAEPLHVDFPGMTAASTRLNTLGEHAGRAADLADDADPDWYTWGLPGLALAPLYWSKAEELHEHLGRISAVLTSHATRIDACAANYHLSETDNADTMRQIRARIDGGTWEG
ncbi:hypothetical protein [Phytomonospora endophytica]|uniref:ESX-1 secretion-associated protein n=1 Tax=Phytomonospora endophytica TaxID=714109 RepID=A0A841FBQ7_9ACTN|nr:hypothetical protein [Phytomonospora endophytica]MBB6033224.1 hypothetical protein [Phytomonospora endophytica]GIG65451.1 hypothetical protein Pen01_17460 [Phytomonospora endophytica]